MYTMSFKIDTKENYTLISPENSVIDVNMAAALAKIIKEPTQNDTLNFIIDVSACQKYDIAANDALVNLHEFVYGEMNGSIVFTGLATEVFNKIKQERLHLSLNITPTMIEAEDIINMEVLERDLLGEE